MKVSIANWHDLQQILKRGYQKSKQIIKKYNNRGNGAIYSFTPKKFSSASTAFEGKKRTNETDLFAQQKKTDLFLESETDVLKVYEHPTVIYLSCLPLLLLFSCNV